MIDIYGHGHEQVLRPFFVVKDLDGVPDLWRLNTWPKYWIKVWINRPFQVQEKEQKMDGLEEIKQYAVEILHGWIGDERSS